MIDHSPGKKKLHRIAIPLFSLLILILSGSFIEIKNPPSKKGRLKITFANTANGQMITLRDSVYRDYFGEQYTINKLRYYISNIVLFRSGNNKKTSANGYYLVDEARKENSFTLSLDPGNYNNFQFLVGVDSARNCSGAQTGALDPMNDMFWTWNSGYVMFKLEGTSKASTADLNRIEHHIGGYQGMNNVITKVNMKLAAFEPLEIKSGKVTEMVIETNLDKYWHGSTDIKIAEIPVCTLPGELAKKIASNFKDLFSKKSIHTTP